MENRIKERCFYSSAKTSKRAEKFICRTVQKMLSFYWCVARGTILICRSCNNRSNFWMRFCNS